MHQGDKGETAEHAASAPPDVLTRFQRFQGVLTDTGSSIPRLLSEQQQLRAQVGRVEVERGDASELQQLRERLDTVGNALASAGRQRSAGCEGLLSISGELREARRAAEVALQQVAQAVINDFGVRWNRVIAELSALHSEAAALTRILRRNVAAVPPYCATVSVDGGRNVVAFSGQIVEDLPLPERVTAITAHLDRLDSALAAVAAVAQAHELDQRFIALQRVRSASMPMTSALYRVIRRFDCLGSQFEVGALINTDILGPGLLNRFWLGKQIVPVVEGASATAA
jgi:hypothetical protein